jgi:DNA-binding winged helix-turn-helix (wHTH) protein
MESHSTGYQAVRFGVFEFDMRSQILYRRGLDVSLEAQPARLLELLIAHANEVVTREDIRQALWPGEIEIDPADRINHAIRCIRGVLHDDPRNPVYIETVPKRGYRFIGQVRTVDRQQSAAADGAVASSDLPEASYANGSVPAGRAASVRSRRVLFGLAAAVTALLVSLAVSMLWASHPDRPVITSVTPILPQPRQTIVIKGHGFGKYVRFSNLDSPFLAIRDKTARWAAGRIMERNFDAVTLSVAAWRDTEIIVTGFHRLYGEHGWKLNPGDRIEIVVWNPQTRAGPGEYHLNVVQETAQR